MVAGRPARPVTWVSLACDRPCMAGRPATPATVSLYKAHRQRLEGDHMRGHV
jgi:hypothetical protein